VLRSNLPIALYYIAEELDCCFEISSVLVRNSVVSFSLTRCWKSSQFVYLLLKHGCFSRCISCVVVTLVILRPESNLRIDPDMI
jgi:hypothetical protein